MTKLEKILMEESNENLIQSFEDNVDRQHYDMNRYGRITKETQKNYLAIKAELLRRLIND